MLWGGMDIKRQVINTPYIVYPKIYLFSRILAQNSEIQNFWEKNYLQMGGGEPCHLYINKFTLASSDNFCVHPLTA